MTAEYAPSHETSMKILFVFSRVCKQKKQGKSSKNLVDPNYSNCDIWSYTGAPCSKFIENMNKKTVNLREDFRQKLQ